MQMNNKLKPVTLIVGASSEISFELIQKFEKTKTLLIVSRNKPQLINENIYNELFDYLTYNQIIKNAIYTK